MLRASTLLDEGLQQRVWDNLHGRNHAGNLLPAPSHYFSTAINVALQVGGARGLYYPLTNTAVLQHRGTLNRRCTTQRQYRYAFKMMETATGSASEASPRVRVLTILIPHRFTRINNGHRQPTQDTEQSQGLNKIQWRSRVDDRPPDLKNDVRCPSSPACQPIRKSRLTVGWYMLPSGMNADEDVGW